MQPNKFYTHARSAIKLTVVKVSSRAAFNIAIDHIPKKIIFLNNEISWDYLRRTKLTDLEYADDICLINE